MGEILVKKARKFKLANSSEAL